MAFLELKNLTKTYYGKSRGIDGVNLALDTGELVALLGPNGCGKTTLMKNIAGLLTPDCGEILINGKPLDGPGKEHMVFQPDEIIFPKWKTVEGLLDDYILFFESFDEVKAKSLLTELEIPLDNKIKELSHGMAEKVQIALDLCRHVDLYLFDEPIAAVDPASRLVIMDMILENFDRNALMLLSTHVISEIETIFDKVVLMDEGKILEVVEVDELRAREGLSVHEYFQKIYGPKNRRHATAYTGPGL